MHRLIQCEAQKTFPIHMGDEIAGFDSSLGCGGIINWGYDFYKPILLRHLNPQPAEGTAGLNAHIAGIIGREVARMRIQRGEHTIDCSFNQLFVINFFDILRADAVKNIPKKLKLFIGFCLVGFLGQKWSGQLRGDHHPKEPA